MTANIAVISGTTHGIGVVTSRELAKAGFTIVMLCRDINAGLVVRDTIRAETSDAMVHVIHCDLASLDSVRKCANEIGSLFDRITLLINNAGAVSIRHRMSVDGFELTFATNHLGPFLLSHLLLDRLSPAGRIINVASRAHYKGQLNIDSITNAAARYNSIAAYAQSKLANVLHTFALARRLAATRMTVNCLHPGIVDTNLLPRWVRMWKSLTTPVIFDAERGARSTLYLALSEEVAAVNGKYFDENQIPQPASTLANNVELQEQLWQASERWVDIRRS